MTRACLKSQSLIAENLRSGIQDWSLIHRHQYELPTGSLATWVRQVFLPVVIVRSGKSPKTPH